MTVGDYTVYIEADRLGIDVTGEDVDSEIHRINSGSTSRHHLFYHPENEGHREEVAEKLGRQRMFEVISQIEGKAEYAVAKTVYEGTRW